MSLLDRLYGKKQDTGRQMQRKNRRQLDRSDREMQREVQKLKAEERKIQAEVKACLRRGDQASARILAKQIVQTRKQQQRLMQSSGQMRAMKHKQTAMAASQKMGQAMGGAARMMGQMNRQVSTQQVQAMMKQFSQESARFDMTSEMMDDTLEDVFDDEGMEEETAGAIGAVLDEIGIETGEQLSQIRTGTTRLGVRQAAPQRQVSDDDVEAMLAQFSVPQG